MSATGISSHGGRGMVGAYCMFEVVVVVVEL
jgi:hypothetical protein